MSDTEEEKEFHLLPTKLDGYTSGRDYSSVLHADLALDVALPFDDVCHVQGINILRGAQKVLGDRLRDKKHWTTRHHDARISPARSQDAGTFYYNQPDPFGDDITLPTLNWDTSSKVPAPTTLSHIRGGPEERVSTFGAAADDLAQQGSWIALLCISLV